MEKKRKKLSANGLDLLSEMEQLTILGGEGDSTNRMNESCSYKYCTNKWCSNDICSFEICNNSYCSDKICIGGFPTE